MTNIPQKEDLPTPSGYQWIYVAARTYVLYRENAHNGIVGDRLLMVRVKRHDWFVMLDPSKYPSKELGSYYSMEMLRREVMNATILERLTR